MFLLLIHFKNIPQGVFMVAQFVLLIEQYIESSFRVTDNKSTFGFWLCEMKQKHEGQISDNYVITSFYFCCIKSSFQAVANQIYHHHFRIFKLNLLLIHDSRVRLAMNDTLFPPQARMKRTSPSLTRYMAKR